MDADESDDDGSRRRRGGLRRGGGQLSRSSRLRMIFSAVSEALEEEGIPMMEADVTMIPQTLGGAD